MTNGIFVVGTGTDVGKTYVSGLLVKYLMEKYETVGYYKAAISGNERDKNGYLIPHDPMVVKKISGIKQDISEMCPYVYERAVSPHLASRLEGNLIDLDVVMDGLKKVKSKNDFVVMEGSGGIICPIRFDDEKIWLEDIIKATKLPCILIADAGLGTINQVVLTLAYMKAAGIKVDGVIFNNYHKGDVMEDDNIKMCEYVTNIPVIGVVSENADEICFYEEKLLLCEVLR